ncbi:MAG: RNA polymerase sigma factor [Candidatus Yonathbacteria bacterium]|nr:RNA polymerase sigma factor [Candidatus Yonathbacteria bacterium]NTW47814.1 RNA polymerase sigma factor [Candidatus Yonathbacteria bacterium]
MEQHISPSDEDAARAVQHGDAEAFAVLIKRYEPKLARYGRKFVANRDDIDDVLQDVFIKAYEHIQSYDSRRAFSPWIYRIAHNAFISLIRKRTREPVIPFDPDTLFPHPVAKETADGDILREEIAQELEKHLDTLDPKYRAPLILYYYEDMDYKAIADILHIPVSTVGVRITRAKKQLLAQYETRHDTN